MNREMQRSRFFYLILFLIVIIPSCGGCPDEYTIFKRKLFVTDLQGNIQPIESGWNIESYINYSPKALGLDEDTKSIYFTEYNPEKIFKINIKTGDKTILNMDLNGESYAMSPNSKYIAYQKLLENYKKTIEVYSIMDSTVYELPTNTFNGKKSLPKWVNNREVAYNQYDGTSGLGIYKVNLDNFNTTQLAPLTASWGYDIFEDGKRVVLSAETRDEQAGLSESSIFLTSNESNMLQFIVAGTYPKFLPKKNQFIYIARDGIHIVDMITKADEVLYSSGSQNQFFDNISISPNGDFIVISDNKGVLKINTDSKKSSVRIVNESDFNNEIDKKKWSGYGFEFEAPIISKDGKYIYFFVTIRLTDSGC